MIKKITFFLFFVFLFCLPGFAFENKWNTLKSTHFIVYYQNATDSFLRQVVDNSEEYYNKIAERLGFTRYNFWLWDNRAKIYIYDDAKKYQEATKQPTWSVGCASIENKVISSFPFAKGFFEVVLPHEMGHIIFREFVGFTNPAVARWLDEGVASYQQDTQDPQGRKLIREALNDGSFMNFEKLVAFDAEQNHDEKAIALFYAESVSIIQFLMKDFGKDAFVYFCQNLRDTHDFNTALRRVYSFSSADGLDKTWQHSLTEK